MYIFMIIFIYVKIFKTNTSETQNKKIEKERSNTINGNKNNGLETEKGGTLYKPIILVFSIYIYIYIVYIYKLL